MSSANLEKPYNAKVIDRQDVSPGLIILRVKPDAPFDFQAGQYTVLGLKGEAPRVHVGESLPPEEPLPPKDKMIKRAYSIASSSKDGEYLEFYLTLVQSGTLTPRLFALEVDDELFVGKKGVGLFTLDRVPEHKHVLLVGTGTGLAPYMSMIRSQLICGGPRKFVVVHGARYSWDLGYRSQLRSWAKQCENLTYIPAISRPKEDSSWAGLSGYVQDIMLSGEVEKQSGLNVSPDNFDVFLCGNPSMIDHAKKRLVELGFEPDQGKVTGNLHEEEYW